MRTTKRIQGFTLIEMLIVVAILGVLAAIGIPIYLHARTAAVERSAQAYGTNVYTVAMAYVSEKVGRTAPVGDCTDSFAAGAYRIDGPGAGAVSSCTVAQGSARLPRVQVVATTGRMFVFP